MMFFTKKQIKTRFMGIFIKFSSIEKCVKYDARIFTCYVKGKVVMQQLTNHCKTSVVCDTSQPTACQKKKFFSRLPLLEAVHRIEWGDLEVVEGQQPQKA